MVRLSGSSLFKPSVHGQHWPISNKLKLTAQHDPLKSPCWKTQRGFSFIHHLLSVRVILSETMHLPKWMQHLQLCSGPSKHIISVQPWAPHQCPALVLAAELLWEKKAPSASPLLPCFSAWLLHGLLPANYWEWLLETEVQSTFNNTYSPGTHHISYLYLITSAIYMSSLSAKQQ